MRSFDDLEAIMPAGLPFPGSMKSEMCPAHFTIHFPLFTFFYLCRKKCVFLQNNNTHFCLWASLQNKALKGH